MSFEDVTNTMELLLGLRRETSDRLEQSSALKPHMPLITSEYEGFVVKRVGEQSFA